MQGEQDELSKFVGSIGLVLSQHSALMQGSTVDCNDDTSYIRSPLLQYEKEYDAHDSSPSTSDEDYPSQIAITDHSSDSIVGRISSCSDQYSGHDTGNSSCRKHGRGGHGFPGSIQQSVDMLLSENNDHLSILINEDGKLSHVVSLVSIVLLLGIILGVSTEGSTLDQTLQGDIWPYVSKIFGYIYFLAWSISNWPQILLNYHNKSTDGLSVDYVFVNLVGFVCYAIFNSSFYWSKALMEAYEKDHDGTKNYIKSEDVFLALQAAVLVGVVAMQIFFYDVSGVFVRMNRYFKAFIIGLIVFILFYLMLVAVSGASLSEYDSTANVKYLNWSDFVFSLSYVKLISTLTKYIPQIILNQKRQSTSGFNIWTVVFDFLGGLFSSLQVVGDCINLKSSDEMKVHVVKLTIGIITMAKNAILILQHYVWYRHSDRVQNVDDYINDGVVEESDPGSISVNVQVPTCTIIPCPILF